MKQNKILHIVLFYILLFTSLICTMTLLPSIPKELEDNLGFGLFGLWFIIGGVWGNRIGMVFILSNPWNWSDRYKLWNYMNMGLGAIFILYSLISLT